MANKKISETITENIFRSFYGTNIFLEKSAIPNYCGFISKKGTDYKGYPDFFKEIDDYVIVVEAKADNINLANEEVKFYMLNNNVSKDIIGISISGQNIEEIKVCTFLKEEDSRLIKRMDIDSLLPLDNLDRVYRKIRFGDSISDESLTTVLNNLNKTFHNNGKVKDTERSLFFSGLMIALKDKNFRNIYREILPPSEEETQKSTLVEANYLNEAILKAINTQLECKINSLSKKISWQDRFSFIKNIEFSLEEYKEIIKTIEYKIFRPFQNDEKRDILGKAYKIFLKKAGKIDNKNIIITPDHIKSLMVELARVNVNDVVLDTCTGTGGFLMEAMEVMIRQTKNDPIKINKIKEEQLIGFEIDPVLFALACSNMFLHGDGRTNMIFRSSLINDNSENIIGKTNNDVLAYIRKSKPTKCIINPPYENNSSIKFTKQALDYLEPNGKLIIIMPTPTLKQNQNGLTEEILKVAKLDFVIKMPNNLFSEQKRTVNTSVFGFTKTTQIETDGVIFYNLEDDGYVSVQHKGRIDKNNKWKDKKDDILASIFAFRGNDNICEMRRIYKDGVLNVVGIQNKDRGAMMVKVSDLFNIEKGTLASEESNNGEYNFITGSEEWKTHTDFTHNTEAIVYITHASGSLGRSHYVNGKFIASNLSIILTPRDNSEYPINMRFYNTYFNRLRKKIVSDLADGTSKLTIDKGDFSNYYIDYINIIDQNNFSSKYIIELEEKKEQLERELKAAQQKMLDNLNEILSFV